MGRKRSASSTPDPIQAATPSSLPLSGSLEAQGVIPGPGDIAASPVVVKKPASPCKKAKTTTAAGRVRRSNRLKNVVKATPETEAQEIERVIEEITSTDSEKEEGEVSADEEAKEVEKEEKDDQCPVAAEEGAKKVEKEDQCPMAAEEEANEVGEEDQRLVVDAEEEEDLVPESNGTGDCVEGLVELCKTHQKTIAELQSQDAGKVLQIKRPSAMDLTYKVLYIASKKKVDVLEKENRRLTKELEHARGRYEGVTEALKLSSKSCCCCSKPQ